MMEPSLLFVLLTIFVATVTYFNLSQRTKTAIHDRFLSRNFEPSLSDSLSESTTYKKDPSKPLALSANDVLATLPPSQRGQLEVLNHKASRNQTITARSINVDWLTFCNSLLEFEEDYTKAPSSKYCFSGFSVEEIKALGDFPDYATLSEVPLPDPYDGFDIDRALPRPYRPFRWAYHQTMSLTKLETDWWLELEQSYKLRIAQRKKLYQDHGDAVSQWLPGSELACKELMEMSLQFLCARYPQYFSLSEGNTMLMNKILGTVSHVREKHPLLVMLDHIPEDFALMIRNPETGYYHFRAGMICSALGWNVATKIGLQLHEIHDPIPDYKEKMKFSMDRFFTKMPTSKPIQRGSWGLEVDQPLYMPPGDPHENYRDFQSTELTIDRCHLRVDWQTLRRLPLSGAIVFNFKAIFTPISEFRDEPYIPSLILKVLREGKESLMKYKNTWHTEHIVIPALEEYENEQIQKGLIDKDWEPHTLDQSPYFPGWEKKWHRQQGF